MHIFFGAVFFFAMKRLFFLARISYLIISSSKLDLKFSVMFCRICKKITWDFLIHFKCFFLQQGHIRMKRCYPAVLKNDFELIDNFFLIL